MAKKEYSKYQTDVISSYYNNLDTIMLQKLGEIVTELFLAETAKKKDRLWDRAEKAMIKLKITPAIRDHIIAGRNTEILAKNLNDWLKQKRK